MSSFPNFSNVSSFVRNELNRRKGNPFEVSKLNCWARLVSAVGDGLILTSNPDIPLFRAAGQGDGDSLYGSSRSSGTIGKNWDGGAVNAEGDSQIGLPRPVISGFEVDEGAGNISRKASFTITAYTRAQLDEVTKYFLEPGFTVFLEWGWNSKDGVSSLSSVNVDYVTKAMSASELRKARERTNGSYECYLGFITGGGISFNGTAWEVNVNLTGFTELPSYLNSIDNVVSDACGDNKTVDDVKYNKIPNSDTLALKRFKYMFNELPSVRRTTISKNILETNDEVVKVVNFINFDPDIREKALNQSMSTWAVVKNFLGGSATTEVGDSEIPTDIKIVDDERFIRFGTFMEILNLNGLDSINIGNKSTSIRINTKNTPISAFEKIYSTDNSKLIIPNAKTPKFSPQQAKLTGTQGVNNETSDCSIKYGSDHIMFPNKNPIENGNVNGIKLFYTDVDIEPINKKIGQWGFLDDLYVNFDFACSVINTPKLSIKDVLYDILNGMSSAVNGFWNFQIIESSTTDDTDVIELRVVDLNFIPDPSKSTSISTGEEDSLLELQLYGPDSVFIDANLDMDIGGAMMNQIIAKRLNNTTTNGSDPEIQGSLFSNETDKVLNKITITCPINDTSKETPDDDIQTRNLEEFFTKVGIYPRVEYEKKQNQAFGQNLEELAYFISYNDKNLFNKYKLGLDREVSTTQLNSNRGFTVGRQSQSPVRDSLSSGNFVLTDDEYNERNALPSILLPIKFTFTVHGISGFRRGDKFVVNGLPSQYGKNKGFFQIVAVKHSVENMTWKTTVEGQFRQLRTE